MSTTTNDDLSDPRAAVHRLRQLDPDAIRARLDEIDDERAALMTLLRATRTARRSDHRAVEVTNR